MTGELWKHISNLRMWGKVTFVVIAASVSKTLTGIQITDTDE